MRGYSLLTLIFSLLCYLYGSVADAHRFGGRRGGWHGGWHGRSHWGGYGGRYYGRSGVGFYFGVPFSYYPYSYYSPYNYSYYYPTPIINIPSSPPVYIHQEPAPENNVAREYPPGYWYYCSDPQGYYPSVKECPNGWIQVEPTPPPPPPPSSSPTQP